MCMHMCMGLGIDMGVDMRVCMCARHHQCPAALAATANGHFLRHVFRRACRRAFKRAIRNACERAFRHASCRHVCRHVHAPSLVSRHTGGRSPGNSCRLGTVGQALRARLCAGEQVHTCIHLCIDTRARMCIDLHIHMRSSRAYRHAHRRM